MIALILYFLIYLWKGEFKYPIVERIIFLLGDGAFLTMFFLFKEEPSAITDNDLDFFILAMILGVDIVLYIVRGIRMFCYGVS